MLGPSQAHGTVCKPSNPLNSALVLVISFITDDPLLIHLLALSRPHTCIPRKSRLRTLLHHIRGPMLIEPITRQNQAEPSTSNVHIAIPLPSAREVIPVIDSHPAKLDPSLPSQRILMR